MCAKRENMNDFVLISISDRTKLNKFSNDPHWNESPLLPCYTDKYVCFSHGESYSFEVLINLFLHGNDSDQIGAVSLIAERFTDGLYDFLCDSENHISHDKLEFLSDTVIPSYLPLFLPKDKIMSYDFQESFSEDIWVRILSEIKLRLYGKANS